MQSKTRTSPGRLALLALLLAPVLSAQSSPSGPVEWLNDFRLYGDNTEFSGPYRSGETILGGQLSSFVKVPIGDRVELLAGAFVDLRSGDEDNPTDTVPILSFRYDLNRTRLILGTLETRKRHGLIDPLMVSTLELTRPVETGLQILSGGDRWSVDTFLNWQKLNTPEHREAFDYGLVAELGLGAGFSLEAQAHGYHEGGQLYNEGDVYNNVAVGAGVSWERDLPLVRLTGVSALMLLSRSTASTSEPERPNDGHALWLRLWVRPWSGGEIWTILWSADDFFAFEGDPNYGSVDAEMGAWVPDRDYKEIGISHEIALARDVTLSAEARLHLIDDQSPEISFRIQARVPISFIVWRPSD